MNFQRGIALFMDYCNSKQLRPRTLMSYEQTVRKLSDYGSMEA